MEMVIHGAGCKLGIRSPRKQQSDYLKFALICNQNFGLLKHFQDRFV